MARPKKDNADYFSHDADMRNDARIKAVRRKFGHVGYSVWSMLLEHLTDCDFFEYEYNELNIELLSGDFDVTPKELKDIISYFIKLDLIQEVDGIIKNDKLITRFDSLLTKRKRDRSGVSVSDNPQSKVKESKVNKSKVKDIKKPLSFVPPSVDEIAEYAKEKGYVADANKIFHYYNDNDWKDSKGNQVKNWKSKILNNWFNERLPDPNEGIFYHNGHAYRPPDPTKPYKCRARGSESYVSKKDYYMYKEEGELCGFKSIRVPDNDAQIKE